MPTPQQPWRPRAAIRAVAIGIVRRGDSVLATAVPDDRAQVKGWRPPGGGIEFGERAIDALVREFREEFGGEITPPRLLGVRENIFEHQGAPGHEVVFVFETAFADARWLSQDEIVFHEDDGTACFARWIDLADVRAGRVELYPAGLIDLLS